MQFYAHHGCCDIEQQVGCRFTVDLSVETDVRTAVQTDCIDQALNYVALYEIVASQMARPRRLLESVGAAILRDLREAFPQIESMRLALSKINPPVGGPLACSRVVMTQADLEGLED